MSIFLRDTRASYDSCHFGASLEEGAITIWKSDSSLPITTVKPGFSGGESRHFVDSVNRLIYSGTWEDGLTCYDYADDRVVWHRNDLIGIQTVNLSAGFPASVFITLERPDYRQEPEIISGIVELDAYNGSSRWRADKGDWVYLHPRKPLIVIQDRRNRMIRILDRAKTEVGSIPMVHFAILNVAFGENLIAIAEGAKGVRVCDLHGKVISHYAPTGRKPNCINVTFAGDRVCIHDSWDGSFVSIIDPYSGKLISEYKRDSHGAMCFIDDGIRFVDSSGRVCQSFDGEVVATLKVESSSLRS